ncbi:MAG: hypothetical protein ABDI20_06040 [Candidatus Bipolaricaulaceae bacterium]
MRRFVKLVVFIFVFFSATTQTVRAFDNIEDWFPPALFTYPLAIGEPLGVICRNCDSQGIPDVIIFTAVGGPKTFFDLPTEDSMVHFYLLLGKPEGWGEPLLVGQFPIPKRQVFSLTAIPGSDLDSDGFLDMAMILTVTPGSLAHLDLRETESYLVILWGCQDGVSFEMDFMQVELGLLPFISLAAGDFNADGLVDLAFTDPQRLALQVLYNQGGRRWSDPSLVSLSGEEDYHLVPVMCVRGRFDGESGDDLAVLSIGVRKKEFNQVLVFLSLRDGQRWERSPLFPLGSKPFSRFIDAVGSLIAGDYDGDHHDDLLFTMKMMEEPAFPPHLDIMAFYVLLGPTWDNPGSPRFIGAMPLGFPIFTKYDPTFGWRMVSMRMDGSALDVLHIYKDGGQAAAALSVPGHLAGAWLVVRNEKREIIAVSSVDLQSGITLFNVITRRSQ